MRKEKEKPKHGENRYQMEFSAPLSLHTCLSLIADLDRGDRSGRFISTSVHQDPLTPESGTFAVRKGSVIVRGVLVKQDESSTWVVCKGDMTLMAKLVYIPFALAIAVGSVAMMAEISFSFGFTFMLASSVILFMDLFKFFRTQDELLSTVHRVLAEA